MRIIDGIKTSARALQAHRLRTALTSLGIVIGVAAVVTMIAVGAGARKQIETAINNIGSNLLVVANGTKSVGGRQTGRGTYLTLTEQDAAVIARSIPMVDLAAGSVAGNGQVIFRNKNWATVLRGVTSDYFRARNWTIGEGRAIKLAEQRTAAKVALLGKSVAAKLFGDTSPIGRRIRVQRVPFTVIGVMVAKGPAPWGGDQDDVVFMPLSTAKKRVFGGRQLRGDLLGQITVKSVSAASIKSVEEEITAVLRRRHGLRPNQPNDFFIQNIAEVLEVRTKSSRTMAMLLASVAGISLLVGGIGIMNIMLVSVSERTREIGIRMAVGARRRDIMVQFIVEALVLSIIGGAVGICMGVAGSIIIARFAEWPVFIEVGTIAFAVILSSLMGVLAGFYPARRASRLDPIEALRRE